LDLKINKILIFLGKLAVSSVFLYLVLSKTGIDGVLSTLKKMNIYAFLTAISLYIFAQFISTLRWKLLLPYKLRTKKLFSLYMIGAFFNTLLPGIIGGDAVKAFYFYRLTGRGSLSLASIFMDRYLGLAVLMLMGVLAYPFGLAYLKGTRIEWLLPFVALSFFAGSFMVYLLRLGKRFNIVSDIYKYFHTYQMQKGMLLKALVLSVFVQLSGISAVYILTLGIGQNIPYITCLIFMPLIILFTSLPISISGIGVREGAFVFFFGIIGIKPEVATAISLSWFLSISAGGLIGLMEYIRYRKDNITSETNQKTTKGD